jgi:hypothetical protein
MFFTNEPARVACGAPDYVLTRKDIPVGYVEAKDIGVDLKIKNWKNRLIDTKRVWLIWYLQITWISFYKDGEFVIKLKLLL